MPDDALARAREAIAKRIKEYRYPDADNSVEYLLLAITPALRAYGEERALAENEECARISDKHWPESGHVHQDGAISCQMSISIVIRRRIPAKAKERAQAIRARVGQGARSARVGQGALTEREIAKTVRADIRNALRLRLLTYRETEDARPISDWICDLLADRDARIARLEEALRKIAEINHINGGATDPIHRGVFANCQAPSCDFGRAALADDEAGKGRGDD